MKEIRQCPSCGGICRKSGCERANLDAEWDIRGTLASALSQQGEPVAGLNRSYTEQLINALHENSDPVSIDAAEEFQRLLAAAPAPQAQHSQYGSEDLQTLILAKLTAPQAQEPARNVTKEEDAILRGALLRSGTVIHPKPALVAIGWAGA